MTDAATPLAMTDTATPLAAIDHPRTPRTFRDRATDSDTMRAKLPDGHSYLYAGLIRTGSVRGLGDALGGIARRIAKRVPGVELHYFVDHLEPMAFCTEHRELASCPHRTNPAATPCRWTEVPATYVAITATGLPVHDNAWFVGGILTLDSQSVVTATTVNGLDGWASEYVELAGTCAHCHTRRARRVSVLLTNGMGQVKAIGRSCLGAFTGGSIRAEILAELISLRERIATACGDSMAGESDDAPVLDVVAVAIILIRQFGFVSRNNATRTTPATAERLRECIVPLAGEIGDVTPFNLTDDDRAEAQAAILAITLSDDPSDYMSNLKAIVANKWCQVTGKSAKLGLLASLPGAAARQVERDARQAQWDAEKAAKMARNEFVGDLGQLVEITGELVFVHAFSGHYGTRFLMKVETDQGAVKWWTTARALVDLEVGARITVAGTVKAHEVYQERNETMLNRPRLVRVLTNA